MYFSTSLPGRTFAFPRSVLFRHSGFAGTVAAFGLLLSVPATPASAQAGWLARHRARVAATQVNQPHWATPLVTGNARVEQGLRADFTRTAGASSTAWNLGGGKGLQLIPLPRTEVRITPPPFLVHVQGPARDGFGDFGLRLKVRAYGSNERHHNAIVSTLLGATLPTGKNGNGSCCAVLSPSVEAGKGFGPFAFTASVGGTLPLSNSAKLGRPVTLNQALQLRIGRFVWLQDEFNSTVYAGGKYDGKLQAFNTPGVVVSRIPLLRSTEGDARLAITVGVGEQIALTHFHTFSRAPILSARLRF